MDNPTKTQALSERKIGVNKSSVILLRHRVGMVVVMLMLMAALLSAGIEGTFSRSRMRRGRHDVGILRAGRMGVMRMGILFTMVVAAIVMISRSKLLIVLLGMCGHSRLFQHFAVGCMELMRRMRSEFAIGMMVLVMFVSIVRGLAAAAMRNMAFVNRNMRSVNHSMVLRKL
jgi:hypothetical protein